MAERKKLFGIYRFRKTSEPKADYETKHIGTLIPYIGPMLILLGVLRLIFFYLFFGIDIVIYLDFTEILTSFLDVVVLGFFLLIIAISIALPNFLHKESFFDDFINENNPRRNLRVGIYFFLFFLALDTVDMILTKNNSYTFYYRFYSGILILTLGITSMAYFSFWTKTISSLRKLVTKVLFILTFVTVLIMLNNYSMFKSIRYSKTNRFIQVVLDSGVVKTDSFNYYIGNTRNYLFVHHEKGNTTTVYPMSRVKEINFVFDSTGYK